MPKRKSVHSLERLCLENVARNMEHVWVKDYSTDAYLRRYHCRYSVGPFSVWAGVLVQELIQCLRERKLLTSSLLCSLLLPQLKELHLTMCPNLVSEPMAHIIAVRCKNLSLLDLRGCSQVPACVLADLVEGLPCLVRLDLAVTQCDTQVLWAVGSSCFRLRQLDITACERVTPDSLIHLAYDPVAKSFRSSALQILEVWGLEPHSDKLDILWALVFVLLALPNLKYIGHDSVAEAVCLIYHQQFDRAQVVPGFPSLKEVASHRRSTHMTEGTPGLTLALREIYGVDETSWPMACAVCPHLEEASFSFMESFDIAQTFLSWRNLVHLAINCSPRRNLRELLPVTSALRARLQSLSLDGYSLEDGSSFHTLLTHCQNLQIVRVILFPPESGGHGWWTGDESPAWQFALPPLHFPHLRDFSLMYSNTEHSQRVMALGKSLISLLRHSPCLEILYLMCLPFPMDEVFQKVLGAPGTALQQLSELSLIQNEVSAHAINLLLSSENKLGYLRLDMCSGMRPTEYKEVKRRIRREGLDVHLVWE
ncbi:hypothetical protein JRQ81_003501 [Phrynocephalus forsythii]|uniref:Uncharacterized protein n=1 Tax=Phrynocephalus forsythii TaxID=171643 RepID=A0A9Q1AXH8_9SAUR|nr:hypothetical protein JRQ81_003501 [Phrynocephalus forsythii]